MGSLHPQILFYKRWFERSIKGGLRGYKRWFERNKRWFERVDKFINRLLSAVNLQS
nr:MAG TPA: Picornaviridae P3A protein [Caudoviricetes sp.]